MVTHLEKLLAESKKKRDEITEFKSFEDHWKNRKHTIKGWDERTSDMRHIATWFRGATWANNSDHGFSEAKDEIIAVLAEALNDMVFYNSCEVCLDNKPIRKKALQKAESLAKEVLNG